MFSSRHQNMPIFPTCFITLVRNCSFSPTFSSPTIPEKETTGAQHPHATLGLEQRSNFEEPPSPPLPAPPLLPTTHTPPPPLQATRTPSTPPPFGALEGWKMRQLNLGDHMSVVFSRARARARSFKLFVSIRRFHAVSREGSSSALHASRKQGLHTSAESPSLLERVRST